MRKILAIWAAKLAILAGKILGKKTSAAPGVIALKICPDIIKILSKNIKKGIVVTCGTNGKTTTNNLLNSALSESGYTTVCNSLGANMISGIATAFLDSANIWGGIKADWAVLEIDEASARRVFAHLTPTHMVVTNLFRDQLDRYGEIDTTMALLNEAIGMADGIKLILNGDDPLTASFGEGRDAVYYGISEKVLPDQSGAKEGRLCIKCGMEQSYNFLHYNQLGDYYCPHCGHKRPEIDFEVKNVDLSSSMKFTINDKPIDINYRGFYNIYNIIAVYSALSSMGIETDSFQGLLEKYKPQIGRMEQIDIGKPFILNLAKNPAGFNQAIQTVMLDKRKKDIIIAVNDAESDGQDVSWLWDVDFEKLCDETLNSLTLGGRRVYDLALRFKYADIPEYSIAKSMKDALISCKNTDAEVCYVLVNYTVLFSTQTTMLELSDEIKNGGEM